MTDNLNIDNIYFILVRPVYLGNIGSMARLLKNFGFTKLRLVEAPRNYKDAEARKMAVGAFDILKESETFETLQDAVADMNFVVGTTAGQQRNLELLPLQGAVARLHGLGRTNQIAIVLGDERNGLSNHELNSCHLLTKIETSDNFPSLNVAQAACVIAYSLATCKAPTAQPDKSQNAMPASVTTNLLNPELELPIGDELNSLFEQIGELLEHIQFYRRFNRETVTNELRRFYYKATPTKREAALLKGVLHKLNHSLTSTGQAIEDGKLPHNT
ncbi:MAG TPA: TrmJ/YjtD family RNA methyltransferase [Drouetiella sp.]